GPTQCHGTPGLQALVDPPRAQVGRAQHLRAVRKPRPAAAVLAVAPDPRDRLDRQGPDLRGGARDDLLVGLGHAGGEHFHAEPLRAVRAQPGLRAAAGPRTRGAEFPHAAALPARPAPDLSELLARLLGGTLDDGRA